MARWCASVVVTEPMLVIGVGSDLRSDDAAGRHVADAIGGLGLDGVDTLSVHQLTPELAAELVGRRLVAVVDAAVDVDAVAIASVAAATSPGAMSHHLDVGVLVAMAGLLGPPPTTVVTVRIPARDLALGTSLSEATAAHVDAALERICGLLAAAGPQEGAVAGPSV